MARLIACAVVCGLVVGCGDDSGSSGSSLVCGAGTHEVDGVCLPVDGAASGGSQGTTAAGGAGGTSNSGGVGGSSGSGGSTSGNGSGATGGDSGSGATGGDSGSGATGGDTGSGGTAGNASTGGSGGSAGDPGAGGTTSTTSTGGSGATGGGGSGSGGTGGSSNPAISTEPFACGSRDVTGATVVQGAITVDTTWSGVVHVTGDVSVRNEATLTIEPGTKVIVGLGYEVDFGWEDSTPTLLAEGTPDAPILFCGETERMGYWKSLSLQESVNPNSVLRNVLIADAGSQGNNAAAALVLHTPALVQGVQIVGAQTVGVETSGFAEGSEVLRVKDSDTVGRIIDYLGIDWPENSDLTGNVNDVILLDFTGIDTSVTFENHGVAYEQVTDIYANVSIGEELIVSFEAGVTYGISRELGFYLNSAVVKANGTSESKVTFTSANDLYCSLLYDCEGGFIRFGTDQTSVLEHTVFQRLSGVILTGNVEFDDVEILDAIETPLTLDYYGKLTPESRGLSIDSGYPAILVDGICDGAGSLPVDTMLPGSAQIELSCSDFEADTVIEAIGTATYEFTSSVIIDDGVHLTLNAGVRAIFDDGRYLRVAPDGSLSIDGTASDPVELAGSDWSGIRSESEDVSIDHAIIDHAGTSTWNDVEAAITTLVPISVTNTTISNSISWGLAHVVADTTDYATSNTFVDNADGDIIAF